VSNETIVVTNPYLLKLREQYRSLQTGINDLQQRAVNEKRDLSEDELKTITGQATEARSVAEQIQTLTEQEKRNLSVGQLAADLDHAADNTRGAGQDDGTSRARTQDRDPGHYRSVKQGGKQSFFRDLYLAGQSKDSEAQRRLDEHMRAVTQASGGTGLLPPKWLTDEYLALGRQNRVLANLVRRIPLGDDPRPLNLPKQTAQTDANLLQQTPTEGVNQSGWGTDRFTTDKDVLTPNTFGAFQDVSRQLLNASDPAVDSLIMGDLRAAWDAKVEALVGAAVVAGGTVSATLATLADATTDAALIDAVVDAQTAVAGDLYGPADIAAMSYFSFGVFRKLKDGNNRPLMPVTRYNPQNATGQLGNVLVGDIEGVDAYGTIGIKRVTTGSAPIVETETIAVMRSQAVLLAESDLLQFSYDQVVGPAAVRMGIFGYVGVLVRRPVSVQLIVITDAVAND
jgi:HK97 family phage major capsid protein